MHVNPFLVGTVLSVAGLLLLSFAFAGFALYRRYRASFQDSRLSNRQQQNPPRFSLKEFLTTRLYDAGLTAVPLGQAQLYEDQSDLGSLEILVASPVQVDDLPKKWHIPVESVKLLCEDGRPIELGDGTHSVVYRALARREQAAVKIMKGNSSSQQAQLLHEIKMMERCVSAHIVRFLGFSVLDAGLVLVMEYMPGGSLFEALGEGDEFQWYKRGRAAILDVAKGLYSMHEEEVIHYDLNSMSILLTKDRNVKIADFGLGRQVADQDAWQCTAVPKAVPWMAPEVLQPCRGLPGSLASDVWSLSTIIWEVCTLERPTRDISSADVHCPGQAPVEVVRLMEACRREDPHERPSMGDICESLENILFRTSQLNEDRSS